MDVTHKYYGYSTQYTIDSSGVDWGCLGWLGFYNSKIPRDRLGFAAHQLLEVVELKFRKLLM